MHDLSLTPAERRQLEQQLRETHDVRVFRRTLAVLEAANGRPVAEVARLLRASRPSVYHWLACYRCEPDPASLADHRGGNRPTLWTEELRARLATSLAQPPDAFGYQAVAWTVPLLQQHLARGYGTPPSETSIRRQLQQQGYVWKRPRYVLAPDPAREKKASAPPRTAAIVAGVGKALRG
jgi:transposase